MWFMNSALNNIYFVRGECNYEDNKARNENNEGIYVPVVSSRVSLFID